MQTAPITDRVNRMSRKPADRWRCAVCAASAIELINAFTKVPRATSDCRPFPPGGKIGICTLCHTVQKPADEQWDADARAIYRCYAMFRQAEGGAEQRVFDPASATSLPRSELVLRRLQAVLPFAVEGRALDVGCGNGPTLRALAKIAPGWRLYGHDISDANARELAAIPGFERLYTDEPSEIPDRFELITLSHSLEHLPDPVQGLAALHNKLSVGGLLLVEVPNLRHNIYDLLVADHRSHFDPLTLAAAARKAEYPHIAVFDDWAFKELTLLASNRPMGIEMLPHEYATFTPIDLAQRVSWLASVVEDAKKIATRAGSFGLFGTAIAATWLFGPLARQTQFFVDEDTSRIGQRHEGRPILAPAQIPAGATVFIPLVPNVAKSVAERLRQLGVDARVPPPQAFDSE